MAGLYVHIPFCHSECTYCDFYRRSYRSEVAWAFLDALEIELSELPVDFVADTVYVGGGTPSALSAGQLSRLLGLLARFSSRAVEYTFEVNPKSATAEKIDALAAAGVQRVSFGAQSFDDRALELMGRRHRARDIPTAFQLIRERVSNVSFDLIFAHPGQTLSAWKRDLERATTLRPDHLSIYSLIYESGTPLTNAVNTGQLSRIDEEVERTMFLSCVEFLRANDFEQYEVSSFAREGRRSIHNESYWLQKDYIGVGPAACSTYRGRRIRNLPDLAAYIESLRGGSGVPCDEEELTTDKLVREMIMLRLRTVNGLSHAEFVGRAEVDLEAFSGGALQRLVDMGFVTDDGERVRLTMSGMCVADTVIGQLLGSR